MNVEEFAKKLDGCECGSEISGDQEKEAKELGYLIVFGYSDDGAEFRGVFSDELGAFGGAKFLVCKEGVIPGWESFMESDPSEEDARKYFERKSMPLVEIKAQWGNDGGPAWYMNVELPRSKAAPFIVMEDGEQFCRGLVIDMSDPVIRIGPKSRPLPGVDY